MYALSLWFDEDPNPHPVTLDTGGPLFDTFDEASAEGEQATRGSFDYGFLVVEIGRTQVDTLTFAGRAIAKIADDLCERGRLQQLGDDLHQALDRVDDVIAALGGAGE